MNILHIERFQVSVLGFTVYQSKLEDEVVKHFFFGFRVWRSKSQCSVLWHQVNENADFDVHAYDKHIADLAAGLKFKMCDATDTVPNRIGYLATEIYEVGGHSKLIRDTPLVLGRCFEHCLFLTRLYWAKKFAARLIKRMSEYMTIVGYGRPWSAINTYWSFKRNVMMVAEAIIKYNPRILLVYIHQNDIRAAAVLALVKRNSNVKIAYYIHATHRPNIGITFSDVVLTTLPSITSFWSHFARISNIYESRSLLLTKGITARRIYSAKEIESVRHSLGIGGGELCTMSGAVSYKYFTPNGESPYFEMVRRLLERNPKLHHIMITSLVGDQDKIVNRIFDGASCRGRLKIINPTSEYERLFSSADVFIDSFPMSSALTMVELLQLKVPFVVKINAEDSLLSFHEYQNSTNKYMFETAEGILEGVERLLRDRNERAELVNDNYKFSQITYSKEACRAALMKVIECSDNYAEIFSKPRPIDEFHFRAKCTM